MKINERMNEWMMTSLGKYKNDDGDAKKDAFVVVVLVAVVVAVSRELTQPTTRHDVGKRTMVCRVFFCLVLVRRRCLCLFVRPTRAGCS